MCSAGVPACSLCWAGIIHVDLLNQLCTVGPGKLLTKPVKLD